MHRVVVGERVPRRGSAAAIWLGRTVQRLSGWRMEGEVPNLPKFVIALAPHTSNWDFVYGASVMFALDMRLAFLGKHTLFVGPLGVAMRWMGGIPVDRSAAHGVVAASIAAFRDAGERVLVITPEGTRKRGATFRPGFLHIARGAGVPVLLVALDYAAKCARVGPVIEPGEDVEADRARIEAYFATIPAKYPR